MTPLTEWPDMDHAVVPALPCKHGHPVRLGQKRCNRCAVRYRQNPGARERINRLERERRRRKSA